MQIGMVGLGRMGANMVRRLLEQGHDCVVFDVNLDNVAALVKEGAVGARLARRPGREAVTATRRLAHAARGNNAENCS